MRSRFFAAAVLVLGLVVFGCSKPRISAIKRSPEDWTNKVVTLTGEVTGRMGHTASGTQFFQIDDGSGELWVLDTGEGYQPGTEVTITGRINTGVRIGGVTFSILLVPESGETEE
jgi:hypothetical protein